MRGWAESARVYGPKERVIPADAGVGPLLPPPNSLIIGISPPWTCKLLSREIGVFNALAWFFQNARKIAFGKAISSKDEEIWRRTKIPRLKGQSEDALPIAVTSRGYAVICKISHSVK